MIAPMRLCLLASAVSLCLAAPYYHAPQQRQLFYPSVVPQYNPYSAFSQYVVPAPAAYRQVYYAPPSAANLIAPVASNFRYPAAPVKQVLYYPGGPFVLAGDEQAEGAGQSWGEYLQSAFGQYIPNFPSFGGASETAEKPAESGGTPAEAPAKKPAKEGEKEKEDEEVKPNEEAKVKGAPQKYVLVGQPQFFGSYGLQKVNPAAVLPSADHGAVSSYLLLKNFPGVRFAPQIPQVPQIAQADDAEVVPGQAALDYQKLLQASRQQKEFSDDEGSVTVDADQLQKEATPDDDKASAPQADEAAASETEEETGTNE